MPRLLTLEMPSCRPNKCKPLHMKYLNHPNNCIITSCHMTNVRVELLVMVSCKNLGPQKGQYKYQVSKHVLEKKRTRFDCATATWYARNSQYGNWNVHVFGWTQWDLTNNHNTFLFVWCVCECNYIISIDTFGNYSSTRTWYFQNGTFSLKSPSSYSTSTLRLGWIYETVPGNHSPCPNSTRTRVTPCSSRDKGMQFFLM